MSFQRPASNYELPTDIVARLKELGIAPAFAIVYSEDQKQYLFIPSKDGRSGLERVKQIKITEHPANPMGTDFIVATYPPPEEYVGYCYVDAAGTQRWTY